MTERDEKVTEQTLLRCAPSLGKLIDAWRKEQLDGPSRSDAIRRLISIALKAEGVERTESRPGAKARSADVEIYAN